jgi:hypothetical protein
MRGLRRDPGDRNRGYRQTGTRHHFEDWHRIPPGLFLIRRFADRRATTKHQPGGSGNIPVPQE